MQEKLPKLTKENVKAIMNLLDDGYHDMESSGYPPYALTSWDDRNRYRKYVEKRLLELTET
jgi:hypothetical protein